MLSRRLLLKKSLLLSAVMQTDGLRELLRLNKVSFKIGACDWSIGKWSDIGAFEVAKTIGVDGIMVDMGSPENNLHLRQKEIQVAYKNKSAETGIAVSSLALGIYNNVPFFTDSRTEEWVTGSIDAAYNMNVKVLLLAFFSASDLRNDSSRMDATINILRNLAPVAEKRGIVLGIESYLDARQHLEIMDKVGSPNLKVYFDFRNTADAGHDPVAEFKKLGKDNVCELHMKENGFLLGKGTIDWKAVSLAVKESGYHGNGWMQIEGAMAPGGDIVESYRYNLAYLHKLFDK